MAEAISWMKEDSEVEVRAEHIQSATSHDQSSHHNQSFRRCHQRQKDCRPQYNKKSKKNSHHLKTNTSVTGAGSLATYDASAVPAAVRTTTAHRYPGQQSRIRIFSSKVRQRTMFFTPARTLVAPTAKGQAAGEMDTAGLTRMCPPVDTCMSGKEVS